MSDIQVEMLLEARTFVIKGNDDEIVLKMSGPDTTVHFTLKRDEFLNLLSVWTADANKLCTIEPGKIWDFLASPLN